VAAQFVQAPLTVLFENKKKSLSLGADGEALAGVGQGPIPKAGVIYHHCVMELVSKSLSV
jgi:hypothetical protein